MKLVTRHLSLVAVIALTMLALAALPSIASASVSSPASHLVPETRSPDSAMPQTTKRQNIVDELKLRMALIDSSADPLVLPDGSEFTFQTDIGKNPIDEWATNYGQEELDAAHSKARISIFDLVRDRTLEGPDLRSVSPFLPVQLRVYKLRDVTPAELRQMLADMQRAAVTNRTTRKEDRQLAGLAVNIYPDSDGFELPKETFELEFGAVSFNVQHLLGAFEQ